VAFDRESLNFLDYMRTSLEDDEQQDDDGLPGEEDSPIHTVIFDRLLPPEQTSSMVAAQGFYHILSLATKGLITVVQEVPYGDIAVVPVDYGVDV
jgi:chromatin segregation and condensation protein Rec8/ScpA/Scc1 (kleisin family)